MLMTVAGQSVSTQLVWRCARDQLGVIVFGRWRGLVVVRGMEPIVGVITRDSRVQCIDLNVLGKGTSGRQK